MLITAGPNENLLRTLLGESKQVVGTASRLKKAALEAVDSASLSFGAPGIANLAITVRPNTAESTKLGAVPRMIHTLCCVPVAMVAIDSATSSLISIAKTANALGCARFWFARLTGRPSLESISGKGLAGDHKFSPLQMWMWMRLRPGGGV